MINSSVQCSVYLYIYILIYYTVSQERHNFTDDVMVYSTSINIEYALTRVLNTYYMYIAYI